VFILRSIEIYITCWGIDLEHRILAQQDTYVGIVSVGLPIIVEIEVLEEIVWLFVVMRIPYRSRWEFHFVGFVFIEGRADE